MVRNAIFGIVFSLMITPVLAQAVIVATKDGAPFKKIRFSISSDMAYCGRMGCEATIEGLDSSGKWIDLTSQKRTMNTYEDKKNGFVGFDNSGMPRVKLAQGTFNGKGSTNIFSYDVRTKRYEY